MSDRFIYEKPEPLITKELIDSLNDPRINVIDSMIKVENELRDSFALKLILEGARLQADKALEAMANVDPTDTKKIINLQAIVYRARFIAQTLNNVLDQGRQAESSLRDETNLVSDAIG